MYAGLARLQAAKLSIDAVPIERTPSVVQLWSFGNLVVAYKRLPLISMRLNGIARPTSICLMQASWTRHADFRTG